MKYKRFKKRYKKYNYSFFESLVNTLGFSSACHLVWAHITNASICKIYVRKINKIVYCRPYTGDFATLKHVFWRDECNILLPTPPQYIFDLGANVGYSSLVFAAYHPDATIIALEPEKNNFELLLQNSRGQNNIVPLQRAVWSHATKLGMIDANVESNSYQYKETGTKVSGHEVTAVTIEDLMKEFDCPVVDLVKMDIEGAELEIFGMEDLGWLQKIKAVSVEVHGKSAQRTVLDAMASQGFIKEQEEKGEKYVFRNPVYHSKQ